MSEGKGEGMEPLFDVIAVNIKTREECVLARDKTERNAEAIVTMAVVRRGVEEEFFTTRPAALASPSATKGE